MNKCHRQTDAVRRAEAAERIGLTCGLDDLVLFLASEKHDGGSVVKIDDMMSRVAALRQSASSLRADQEAMYF